MRTESKRAKGGRAWLLCIAALLTLSAGSIYGQTALTDDVNDLRKSSQTLDPANGTGVMVAGELWDSFKPPNTGAWYGEAALPIIGHLLRIGNFDRAWTTPTHMWPGGWNMGNYWAKDMYIAEYNPDKTWNPPTIGGPNPSYVEAADSGRYAVASFGPNIAGVNDPTRTYARETRWVDSTLRQHALYEAGWPTTIGVDVQITIHQFELNWNNLNDFIVVEIKLINTGDLDMNADGVVERSGNVIRALTALACGEFMSSYYLSNTGGRGNSFGAQRAIGYIGDNDGNGEPWDMMIGFPGESLPGTRDMGINAYTFRYYTDTWSAWSWIDVKDAGGNPKQTIYGTHPIGAGTQRGWFISAGQGRGLGIGASAFGNPKNLHIASMGTYYTDGGKSRDATKFNLNPDPNFFASGTAGDPTTFVPKGGAVTPATRPRGDRKLFSEEDPNAFEVNTYETGWTKGFTGPNNFDGDMFSAVGPFSLAVGEEITIVWAEAGGYRLEGVTNAIAAARWMYGNDYNPGFTYPAVPDVRVDNTPQISSVIRWDNRAEAGAGFAGYKIYKSSQVLRFDWLQSGMRGLDDYWRQTTAGPTDPSLLKPVNPQFAGEDFVRGVIGAPDSWGPYQLIAVIPQASLGSYADNSVAGYNYSFEDTEVQLGARSWYYVAAYTSGSYNMGPTYAGSNPPSTTSIETSNMNRNGASGLWANTYPFAEFNAFWPTTAAGLKAIGAPFVVQSPARSVAELDNGTWKISVKPNPYKKKNLIDNPVDPFDHRIVFYNLPPKGTITILDVAGQIIQQIPFEDPTIGSVFWNLFSKDGIEVASGLYIYVIEYEGRQHVGYFSVLR